MTRTAGIVVVLVVAMTCVAASAAVPPGPGQRGWPPSEDELRVMASEAARASFPVRKGIGETICWMGSDWMAARAEEALIAEDPGVRARAMLFLGLASEAELDEAARRRIESGEYAGRFPSLLTKSIRKHLVYGGHADLDRRFLWELRHEEQWLGPITRAVTDQRLARNPAAASEIGSVGATEHVVDWPAMPVPPAPRDQPSAAVSGTTSRQLLMWATAALYAGVLGLVVVVWSLRAQPADHASGGT